MVHQHGPIKLWCYSFSLFSSSFWLWLLVSTCTVATVQGTCTVALRGYLFPPIIRNIHHTRDMMFASELPEKKRSLAFIGKSRNKTGKFLLPHLTFFAPAQLLEMVQVWVFFPPFSQQQFTRYNITASQHPLTVKQRWTDFAGLFLDATSASHKGYFFHSVTDCPLYFPASLMQLQVPHSSQLSELTWRSLKHNHGECIPILLFKQGNKEAEEGGEGWRT